MKEKNNEDKNFDYYSKKIIDEILNDNGSSLEGKYIEISAVDIIKLSSTLFSFTAIEYNNLSLLKRINAGERISDVEFDNAFSRIETSNELSNDMCKDLLKRFVDIHGNK